MLCPSFGTETSNVSDKGPGHGPATAMGSAAAELVFIYVFMREQLMACSAD